MSAKSSVSRLRSPPLALSVFSISSSGLEAAPAGSSGLLHLPQKRLAGGLAWAQAMQTSPSGLPQVVQNELVALLSLRQDWQSMGNPGVREKITAD